MVSGRFSKRYKKNDNFQIMFETFVEIIIKLFKQEIFFANLKLSGQDNSLYFFDKEEYWAL